MIDRSKPHFGGNPASAWRTRLALAPADPGGEPTVSIVTRCRDAGAGSLAATIAAVQGQSLQAFEWLLLVDPETPGNGSEQIAELAARDPRLRVLEHREPLAREALRTAASRARAPLVALLGADEILEPTALETLAACLASDPELGFARGLAIVHGDRHRLLDEDEDGAPAEVCPARVMLRRVRLAALLDADPEAAGARDLGELLERLSAHGVRGCVVPEHLHWIPWRAPREPRRTRIQTPSELASRAARATPGPDQPLVANPLARRRKRLLALVPRFASEASGAAFAFALQNLGRLGWQVTVAALHAGEEGAEATLARLTPDLHVLERAVRPDAWPRHLRGLLASRRPDVVLFDAARVPGALLAHLRAHAVEPRYVAFHHLDPDEPAAQGAGHPLEALPDADVVLTSGIEPEPDGGTRAGRPLWLPVSVDSQVWQPRAGPRGWLRPNWGAGEDDAVILFAGPLTDRARLDLVVRSLAGLRAGGAHFVAVIAGEGAERPWLAAELERRGLSDRVRMPADASRDILRSMAAADVFFSPAHAGFASRLAQAMAMELAVVATDTGGQSALVTPACGRLVAIGERELQGYVEALAALVADPSLRRALGRAARERVLLHFGPDRLAQELESAFRSPNVSGPERPNAATAYRAAIAASLHADERERLRRCAAALAGQAEGLAAEAAARARDLERERGARSALEARLQQLVQAFEQRGRELNEIREQHEALHAAHRTASEQRAGEQTAAAAREALLADSVARLESLEAAHRTLQRDCLRLSGELGVLGRRWWRPRSLARRASEIARSLGRLDRGGQTP